MRRAAVLGMAIALAAGGARAAPPLEVTHVQRDPVAFNPAKGQSVAIRFHLSAPATASVRIYDGRDLQIRTLGSAKPLPAGDVRLTWNGRDARGRLVPPEAYHYTVDARAADGREVEYDITDRTGGEEVMPGHVHWDPREKKIHYILPRPARVAIRVGLENGGPILGTVLDWVPRPAGKNVEAWNGRDASGVLDLSHHPNLLVGIRAFALPDNAILVLPLPRKVQLIQNLPADTPRRVRKWTPPSRLHDHAEQPITTRGDFQISLTLPPGLRKNAKGIPVVRGPVPLRLEVAPSERKRAWNRRFEATFFVDGTFVYEDETGFLPLTWRWDPKGANPGEHYVTANVRGYEGNFGAATVRLWVAGAPRSAATEGETAQ